MAVYVDPLMEWPKTPKWRFGAVSHMFADTPEELHALATKIGMKRQWCSDVTQPQSVLLHYDLSPGARAKAVKAGAQEVGYEETESFRLRVFNRRLVQRGLELKKQYEEALEEVEDFKALVANLRKKLKEAKEVCAGRRRPKGP